MPARSTQYRALRGAGTAPCPGTSTRPHWGARLACLGCVTFMRRSGAERLATSLRKYEGKPTGEVQRKGNSSLPSVYAARLDSDVKIPDFSMVCLSERWYLTIQNDFTPKPLF